MCWWWWCQCPIAPGNNVMAWLIVDPFTDGGGGTPSDSDWLPYWHIIVGETVTVPTRKEYALHGELLLEGTIHLDGSSRLRMER